MFRRDEFGVLLRRLAVGKISPQRLYPSAGAIAPFVDMGGDAPVSQPMGTIEAGNTAADDRDTRSILSHASPRHKRKRGSRGNTGEKPAAILRDGCTLRAHRCYF